MKKWVSLSGGSSRWDRKSERVVPKDWNIGNDQDPKKHPFPYSETHHSHQQRWSADFCRGGTSSLIIVRKNKKEPQPPQRSVSLLKPNTAAHPPSLKRFSYTPTGLKSYPTPQYSSSCSSSIPSCSSSTSAVQTNAITGRDPLGWKLRPKSWSPGAHARRLSLQMPLPVIYPDKTSKPDLRPKPSHHRHHSDSTALLRSVVTPVPVGTATELYAVHRQRHTFTPSDVFYEYFCQGNKDVTQTGKTAPPIPVKTSMARQRAQLIAQSHQQGETNEDDLYSFSRQTEGHSS